MTRIETRIKHERYDDINYYSPYVSVENMCTIEDFEFKFLEELTQWVNDYWTEVKKNE